MAKKPHRGSGPPANRSTTSVTYQGPLPLPNQLARYEELVPGSAERIISMAEHQAEHRQGLERTKLKGDQSAERLGSIFGFTIVMSALGAGVYLIMNDKSAEGLASIITSLASLAGIFIYGRYSQRKERERNQVPPPEQRDS